MIARRRYDLRDEPDQLFFHVKAPHLVAQLLDPRGTHTFESVRNARALGHRSLLIVSQRFHLPRALYLAGRMGIDAVGVAADLRHYAALKKMEQREVFSSVLAYWMARATS